MIQLFPLRPVQIVDLSFQLLRRKFMSSFLIGLLVAIPLQAIVWIFEIYLAESPGQDLTQRTMLIIAIFQFSSIGISLALVSNLLTRSTGRVYSQAVFNNIYKIQNSPARIAIAAYHVGVQLGFLFAMIGIRFLFGRFLVDDTANLLTLTILVLAGVPWIFVTLRFGFSVPISTHEGGSFTSILKRTKEINRIHFFKLFGVYCICVFMILILVLPSLTIVQMIIANGFIKSDVGQWAFFNLIASVIIASISVVYSYILTATYFNARIEYEGFDIAVSIEQLESEGSEHGKLLDPVA